MISVYRSSETIEKRKLRAARGSGITATRFEGPWGVGDWEKRSCVLSTDRDTLCLSSRKWRSGRAMDMIQPSTLYALSAIQEMRSAVNKQVGAHGTKVLNANKDFTDQT